MKISTGKIKKPLIMVVYGPDGVGKTTFASEAPAPIFIGAEDGTANIDVTRAEEIKTFSDVRKAVVWLATERHDFKTVVIDSLDWLEPKLWKEICESDTKNNPAVIEDALGGYGKGFVRANQLWLELMQGLAVLRDKKGMNVVVIAHSQVKAFNDPTQLVPYDRYQMKLNEKAAALWREFSDAVFFLNYDVSVKKDSGGSKKGKAFGDGETILFTKRNAAYDAKNRHSLPSEIPMIKGEQWSTLQAAIGGGVDPDSIEGVAAELQELLLRVSEDNKAKMSAAIVKAGKDLKKLTNIRNHARKLEE